MAQEKRSDILRRGLERLSPELRAHFTMCERCKGEGNLWHLPEFAGKDRNGVFPHPSPDGCANCERTGLLLVHNRGCDITVGDILCGRVIFELGMLKLAKRNKSVG